MNDSLFKAALIIIIETFNVRNHGGKGFLYVHVMMSLEAETFK